MTAQGSLLPRAAGTLVNALVGAALLQQGIERQRVARPQRSPDSLFGPLHREWNFTTARPSATCRGSGFQAWP